VYHERGDLPPQEPDRRGLEPVFDTPEEFARFLGQDRIEAQCVVKDAGLLPQ
jgi:hypothetical protein